MKIISHTFESMKEKKLRFFLPANFNILMNIAAQYSLFLYKKMKYSKI